MSPLAAKGEVLAEDRNHVSGGNHTQHPEFALARWVAKHMSAKERSIATVYTSRGGEMRRIWRNNSGEGDYLVRN